MPEVLPLTMPPTTSPVATVHQGDWLALAPSLPPATIDLLYADPPFNTGKRQVGHAGAYKDAWPTLDHWLDWLRARLLATIPALKPTASILLHLDFRTSHRARCLLDDLLGPDRFVNHLIWSYGLGGSSPRRFARKHDDILFYALNPDLYYFEPPMVPATSNRLRGQLKKATDVLDIPSINNMSHERTGYPTQKPLALLDVLVRACCPPAGVVLDPCCGSGTTLVASWSAGRSAIGFDQSAAAFGVTRARLDAIQRHEPRGASPRP